MGKPLAKEFTDRIYQPGNPGGPGRPKGSRTKLQEQVIRALYEDFSTHGPEAIERVRQRKPEVYLMACVSLLPKQAQKIESPFSDISDGELEALEQHLAVVRAKMVNQIEGTAFPPEGTQDHGNGVARGRVANTAPEDTNGSASGQNGQEVHGQASLDLSAELCVSEDDAA